MVERYIANVVMRVQIPPKSKEVGIVQAARILHCERSDMGSSPIFHLVRLAQLVEQ